MTKGTSFASEICVFRLIGVEFIQLLLFNNKICCKYTVDGIFYKVSLLNHVVVLLRLNGQRHLH